MFIAITGKGGTGKTTIAALLVRALVEREETPLLIVDADPNTNLDLSLGVKVRHTVGEVREEALKRMKPEGMTWEEWLRLRLEQCLVERKHFDFLAMGRPEGPGCYCYANHLLRLFLEKLRVNYKHVIVDCEAGMEHLSRRTVGKVDFLIVVTEPSLKGLNTSSRIIKLAREMGVEGKQTFVLLNRLRSPQEEGRLRELARREGMTVLASIPEDKALYDLNFERRTVWDLSSSPALDQIRHLASLLLDFDRQPFKVRI